jgi:hypothetical protein
MTPSRDEMSPKPLKNPDNYGIEDLKSDEVILLHRLFKFMRAVDPLSTEPPKFVALLYSSKSS